MSGIHILSVLSKLQQGVLRTDDIDMALGRLLPVALEQLSSLSLTYQFISAVFINEDYSVKQSFFAEAHSSEKVYAAGDVITLSKIFSEEGFLKDLLWGEIITSEDTGLYISSSYHDFIHIKSITIIPIFMVKNLAGLFILGSPRSQKETKIEELEAVEMVANELGLVHRLEDTQNSLKKVTEEVYKMNKKLHEFDQLKDEFVSLTSHELRTPMTVIRAYAWMALNKPDVSLSEKMKKYLVRILISTDRLINLVNEMLNISRIESGRVEINPEPVDLILICRDIIDEIYYSKSTTKTINFHLLEQPLPKVFADPDKLRQVFLNIVGNALKFSPPNGNITIGFFTDGQIVETFIKDEGPGISKENIGRLFQKFGRLDSSYEATATSGGTGLGLYISKSLIDLMHGKIRAESEGEGKGVTFKFTLPVATKENLANIDEFRVIPKDGAKKLEPVAV